MLFSLVIPLHNVEAYLGSLLDSIDRQLPGGYELECVIVDDGSTDRSGDLAETWLRDRKAQGTLTGQIIRQFNRGVSAARNAGLAAATGEWVTFPDSDDFLDPGYFRSVAAHIDASANRPPDLVCANLVFFHEADGSYADTHALKHKFASGRRNVRLSDEPETVQMSMASAFAPRAALERTGLRFPDEARASEDSLFALQLLLADPDPVVGLVPDARYYYRRRAAGDSATQNYRHRRSAYIDRLAEGYLPLVRAVAAERGRLPRWVGCQLLYELTWLYAAERRFQQRSTALTPADKILFVKLTAEICEHLETDWIRSYSLPDLTGELRCLFLALRGDTLTDLPVWIEAYDPGQGQVLARYATVQATPVEYVEMGGQAVQPRHRKTVALDYFGQTALWERRLWIDLTGPLTVNTNGQARRLRLGRQGRSGPLGGFGPDGLRQKGEPTTLTPAEIMTHFAARQPLESTMPLPRPPALPRRGLRSHAKIWVRQSGLRLYRFLNTRWPDRFGVDIPSATSHWGGLMRAWPRRLAVESLLARLRYRRAWVLLDRADQAHDNAERLFDHLREHHREVRAYFVLQRESPDWDRLRAKGVHLVSFRSTRHLALVRQAAHVVSSHADPDNLAPAPYERYPFPLALRGSFTFLQHGITKDNVSVLFNRWEIAQVIASTVPEYAAFTGDRTPYALTTKEVCLTGLPRFDRLRRLREAASGADQILLAAPTWRHSFAAGEKNGQSAGAASNRWTREWLALLEDTRLRQMAEQAGLRIVFLPHPNMASLLSRLPVPAAVEVRTHLDSDVQELLAVTRVLVTDYSSLAFDAAYAGADVVYFQFDKSEFFSGRHTYTPGYFSYDDDGFGPVTGTVDEAVEALGHLLGSGRDEASAAVWRSRSDNLFPVRDGSCCERAVAAIAALDRPPDGSGPGAKANSQWRPALGF
ncbi:MAG: CDP-glycerol glycerophosphotransferase family protein [Propionibacteriaceae bacterium]|nr:CDP-glycerol glycerophosphotransferase family protein [Propionibacteriaceae bacterium]